jgi:hypothetical protein
MSIAHSCINEETIWGGNYENLKFFTSVNSSSSLGLKFSFFTVNAVFADYN